MKFLVLIVTLAIVGCGDPGLKISETTHAQPGFEAPWSGIQGTLSMRVDTARNRLWLLAMDHVDVYDIKEKRLIQRIALPGWSVTDYICQPDIALDQSGTAFISDNAQPRLWQVDADSFQLKEHVVRLVNKEHWDVGFSGLAFAADGSLLGIDASGGSLWVIDIESASAHQVLLDTRAPLRLTQHPYCKRATAAAQ